MQTCDRGVTAIITLAVLAGHAFGQDSTDKADSQEVDYARQRFELMQSTMQQFKSESPHEGVPDRFSEEPIFTYTDPARQYLGAALWKLGEKGRPLAIVSTELHRNYHGRPRIVFEYLCLTDTPLDITTASGSHWIPAATALAFQTLPVRMAVESTPQRRGLQLRSLARRFSAEERVGREEEVLRLIPAPIVRYQPTDDENSDGGLFLMSYGTNPEAALFIETSGEDWSFAVGRLSGASRLTLSFDDELIWSGQKVSYGWSQPYTASNSHAVIPGLNPE